MSGSQIILASVIVGLSIVMPMYYSYKIKKEKQKIEDQIKESKYVTEKDLNMVIRIYGEDGFGYPKPVVIPRHCEIDTEFCPIVR